MLLTMVDEGLFTPLKTDFEKKIKLNLNPNKNAVTLAYNES